jgi:outer membrane protein assembly factor BamE (lipoprotein component of BamABCDE complex)
MGCSATYRNHGYVPSEDELAALELGKDTRDSVMEAVGAPGFGGVLDSSAFYYVQTRVKNEMFYKPTSVDRQVVAISFDSAGRLRNVERFGLEDGQIVPLARRVTDNSVQNNGLVRQLLRNLGNFNPAGALAQN